MDILNTKGLTTFTITSSEL